MKQPSFLLYDISFHLHCLAAAGNLVFLTFITVRSANKYCDAINRWDLIYHAHNLGAHICSVVSIANMWRPKGFLRSPTLSIVHFIATEAVKLYFAAEWSTYWPRKDSTYWLVYQVTGLNTTGDPDKIAIFDWSRTVTPGSRRIGTVPPQTSSNGATHAHTTWSGPSSRSHRSRPSSDSSRAHSRTSTS
jgi:hypothetical protein